MYVLCCAVLLLLGLLLGWAGLRVRVCEQTSGDQPNVEPSEPTWQEESPVRVCTRRLATAGWKATPRRRRKSKRLEGGGLKKKTEGKKKKVSKREPLWGRQVPLRERLPRRKKESGREKGGRLARVTALDYWDDRACTQAHKTHTHTLSLSLSYCVATWTDCHSLLVAGGRNESGTQPHFSDSGAHLPLSVGCSRGGWNAGTGGSPAQRRRQIGGQ